MNDERQRKCPNVIELAVRGLEHMGFAKTDARAIEEVARRRAATGEALEAPALLRDAITALTSASRARVS